MGFWGDADLTSVITINLLPFIFMCLQFKMEQASSLQKLLFIFSIRQYGAHPWGTSVKIKIDVS